MDLALGVVGLQGDGPRSIRLPRMESLAPFQPSGCVHWAVILPSTRKVMLSSITLM